MPSFPISRLFAPLLAAALLSAASAGAQEAAEPGSPDSVTETYRDWTLRCGVPPNAPAGTPRSCEMLQELGRQAGGQQQRVLAVFVSRGDSNGGQLRLITPLGLALPAGVVLTVGEQVTVEIAYATCRPAGCISGARLEGELLAALIAGTTATVRVRTLDGQDVPLDFSLNGFTAAWNRLAEL